MLKEKTLLKNDRGIVLIASLSLISALSILTLSLFNLGLIERGMAERYENRLIAFHATEAGLDQTIVQLRNNRNFAGAPSTPFGRGSYQTVVTQSPNPNIYQIQATGTFSTVDGGQVFGLQQRVINAYVNIVNQSPFAFSIFANTGITMSGNAQTDSYDSRNGPYGGANRSNNGSIGTNGTTNGIITLSGNTQINGNAVVGPGANPQTAITTSGNAVIWGSRSAAPQPTPLPPVQIPQGLSCSGNLSISGNNTVALPGGTYCYSTISISGNGRLNVTGAASIYVIGRVDISGNGVGTSQNLPTSLSIYGQGVSSGIPGGGDIKISGNGNFYGAIYAPQSKIDVSGNGEIYGALVGNEIKDSGNGNIHYDEALNLAGTSGNSPMNLISWNEQ